MRVRALSVVPAALAVGLLSCGGGGGGGGSGYQIDLRFLVDDGTLSAAQQGDPVLQAQRDSIGRARDRLLQAISAGIAPVDLKDQNGNALTCGDTAPDIFPLPKDTVQGIRILFKVENLGSPNLLASSGPCIVRGTSKLPAVALMLFNSANIESLQASGNLEDVALHEMIHTLGFGTLWISDDPANNVRGFGLLANAGTADPRYTGGKAIDAAKAQNRAPGSWSSIPVESTGGSGTAESHWRQSVFVNELMVGTVNLSPNAQHPLSATSLASLADLGYSIDLGKADAFTIPNPNAALRAPEAAAGLSLDGDVLRLPIHEVAE